VNPGGAGSTTRNFTKWVPLSELWRQALLLQQCIEHGFTTVHLFTWVQALKFVFNAHQQQPNEASHLHVYIYIRVCLSQSSAIHCWASSPILPGSHKPTRSASCLVSITVPAFLSFTFRRIFVACFGEGRLFLFFHLLVSLLAKQLVLWEKWLHSSIFEAAFCWNPGDQEIKGRLGYPLLGCGVKEKTLPSF